MLLALATTVGLCGLALAVWRNRAVQAGGPLIALLAALGLWVLTSGIDNLFHDVAAKVLLAKLSWIGIVAVPPATLLVALHASGRIPTANQIAALIPVPAVLLFLVATNEYHHLIWTHAEVDLSRSFPDLDLAHGPAFWVSVVYSYVLLAAAAGLFLHRYLLDWREHLAEAVMIGLAFSAPWAANVVYLFTEGEPSIDLTPYAFSVSAACLAVALWNGRGLVRVLHVVRSEIVDEMSDGALVVDVEDRLFYANRAARAALSINSQRPLPRISDVLADFPDLLSLLAEPEDGSREIQAGDTTHDVRVTTLRDVQGQATSRIVVMRDITHFRSNQQARATSEDLFFKVIDAMPHMIFAKDREGRFIVVNRCMAENAGVPARDMIGRAHQPEHIDPEQYETMIAEDVEIIDSGEPRFHRQVQWVDPQGQRHVYQVNKIPFTNPQTGDGALLGVAIDITPQMIVEEQMRNLAYFDGLTGLPNRRRFQTVLDRTLETAKRKGTVAALLFLDLDRFKEVNDRLGHARGDQLLREVSDRVRDCIRFSDQMVRPNAPEPDVTVSRLGGDEFTILLSNIDEPLDAAVVAMRILDVLSDAFTLEAHEVFTSASIGIAIYPDDGRDSEELFRNADRAMYHAKDQGRNRYAFFSAALNEASVRRHAIEQGLHSALEREELSLHYQPIRCATSGELLGAEALLRWRCRELGEVRPDELLPIAEDTGLINAIGEWVLRSACEQHRRWREQGLRPIRLSINLSPTQVQSPGLPATIDRILASTGMSPDWLEVEITESTVMGDDDLAKKVLSKIRDSGVSLALDDFGTGYSSLSHLRRFEFDVVKIDRSFVREMATCLSDRAIIDAIVAMAHALDLRVTAEGVETIDQLEALRESGCDALQGHLLSEAVPPDEFVRFLEADKPEPGDSDGSHD